MKLLKLGIVFLLGFVGYKLVDYYLVSVEPDEISYYIDYGDGSYHVYNSNGKE